MLILDAVCSTLVPTTSEARVTITLRQHHAMRHGHDIGTCTIDCSTIRGTLCQLIQAVQEGLYELTHNSGPLLYHIQSRDATCTPNGDCYHISG